MKNAIRADNNQHYANIENLSKLIEEYTDMIKVVFSKYDRPQDIYKNEVIQRVEHEDNNAVLKDLHTFILDNKLKYNNSWRTKSGKLKNYKPEYEKSVRTDESRENIHLDSPQPNIIQKDPGAPKQHIKINEGGNENLVISDNAKMEEHQKETIIDNIDNNKIEHIEKTITENEPQTPRENEKDKEKKVNELKTPTKDKDKKSTPVKNKELAKKEDKKEDKKSTKDVKKDIKKDDKKSSKDDTKKEEQKKESVKGEDTKRSIKISSKELIKELPKEIIFDNDHSRIEQKRPSIKPNPKYSPIVEKDKSDHDSQSNKSKHEEPLTPPKSDKLGLSAIKTDETRYQMDTERDLKSGIIPDEDNSIILFTLENISKAIIDFIKDKRNIQIHDISSNQVDSGREVHLLILIKQLDKNNL